MKTTCIILLAVIAIAGSVPDSYAEVQYSVIDLHPFGIDSVASDINSKGQVVGYAGIPGGHQSFLFDSSTMTATDLGSLVARGIDDRGQIVGCGHANDPIICHAFVLRGTAFTDLGTLGGRFSYAYRINRSGWIVGSSEIDDTPTEHAFLYDGKEMHDLGTLGGTYSVAWDINVSGQAVGYSTTASGYLDAHAVLYTNSTIVDLQPLVGCSWSSAQAINDKGSIVGIAGNHAFLLAGSCATDLGVLGGSWSCAYDINDAGTVVGSSDVAGSSERHAFLYDGSTLIDLNTMIAPASGWELTGAYAINESGQIVGYGNHNGSRHAFLMTPVPEPSAIVLLASLAIPAVFLLQRCSRRS